MRRRTTVLGLLAVGGLLALVVSAQGWWQARADGTSVSFSGAEATGGLSQALAVVSLAGLLLTLTLRRRGRRVLAVLLGVTGLAMVLLGALRIQPSADAVRTRVRQVSLVDQFALTTTIWPWCYAGAGAVLAAGAALLWVAAPRWPQRADRFSRTTGAPAVPADLEADPTRAWQDLDAGRDPTVDPDPDVRICPPGVTMEDKQTSQTTGIRDDRSPT